MACVIHTDRPSVAICVACNNEICEECRIVVAGRNYCPNCAPAQQQQPAQPAGAPPPPPPSAAPAAGGNEVLVALAYPIWIISLILLLMDTTKRDPYARKHAWTALFWGIGVTVVWVALWIVLIVLAMVPFLGQVMASLLGLVLGCYWVVWLVFSIIFAVKAYNHQEFTIPLITDLAAKQYRKPV